MWTIAVVLQLFIFDLQVVTVLLIWFQVLWGTPRIWNVSRTIYVKWPVLGMSLLKEDMDKLTFATLPSKSPSVPCIPGWKLPNCGESIVIPQSLPMEFLMLLFPSISPSVFLGWCSLQALLTQAMAGFLAMSCFMLTILLPKSPAYSLQRTGRCSRLLRLLCVSA